MTKEDLETLELVARTLANQAKSLAGSDNEDDEVAWIRLHALHVRLIGVIERNAPKGPA